MSHSPFRKYYSCSASQEILHTLWNPKIRWGLTTTWQWPLFWVTCLRSALLSSIILILYSLLLLGLERISSHQTLLPKRCKHCLSLPCVLHVLPIRLSSIWSTLGDGSQSWSRSLNTILYLPVTSFLVRSKCFSQHHVLKQCHSIFFPYYKTASYINNTRDKHEAEVWILNKDIA